MISGKAVACSLAVILPVWGCAQQSSPRADRSSAATVLNFRVTGMHCDGCAAGLKAKLVRVEGVTSADASFEQSSASVKTDDPTIAVKVLETIKEMQFQGELIEG